MLGRMPFFSGSYLNRISCRRSENLLKEFSVSKFILFDVELCHLTRSDQTAYLPQQDLAGIIDLEKQALFLGIEKSEAYWAVAVGNVVKAKIVGTWAESRQYFASLGEKEASLLGHARSLVAWNMSTLYCGKCGQKTIAKDWGHKKECGSCRTVSYPRMDPVVITLILNKTRDSCLLGRISRHPPKLYSCLAGYLEQGESIEDAVLREIREESNIRYFLVWNFIHRVHNVTYVASQPWPYPYQLMIGCLAFASDTDPIQLTDGELESVKWFTKDQVRSAIEGAGDLKVPKSHAIANTLISHWIKE